MDSPKGLLFLFRGAAAAAAAAAAGDVRLGSRDGGGPETDLELDGLGLSAAQTSQHKKLGGFSSVQVVHVHG